MVAKYYLASLVNYDFLDIVRLIRVYISQFHSNIRWNLYNEKHDFEWKTHNKRQGISFIFDWLLLFRDIWYP